MKIKIILCKTNGIFLIKKRIIWKIPLQLFYRNKMVSDDFPYTAKGIQAGQIVSPQVMGEYYPCGKYIDPGSLAFKGINTIEFLRIIVNIG